MSRGQKFFEFFSIYVVPTTERAVWCGNIGGDPACVARRTAWAKE
jgi:hypothetical protein